MLWLALYFPDLPLQVFVADDQQDKRTPMVVSHNVKGKERVLRFNKSAGMAGIGYDMSLNHALSLVPDLKVQGRNIDFEEQALQGLAHWAYQYSSHISLDPLLVLLEVDASLKLFSGLTSLLSRIDAELKTLGYRVRCASAPTAIAAALLARTKPGTHVTTQAALVTVLADISIRRLTRDKKVRALLKGIGLDSIGDCLALPAPELARRTQPGFIYLLNKLLGKAPDPRSHWLPPSGFSQRLILPAEASHTQALVFPAKRLLILLCGFLRGQGGATQQLHWSLIHRDNKVTQIEQGMLRLVRDVESLLRVYQEHMENTLLPEPVIEIELSVNNWQAIVEVSDDWLNTTVAGKSADNRWLESIQARLHKQAVQGLALLADHRPEFSWHSVPVGTLDEGYKNTKIADKNYVVWLLEQPELLATQNDKPIYQGELVLLDQPERIESGWWDGADVSRDYYPALNPVGKKLWVYQNRRTGKWYLHGLFD